MIARRRQAPVRLAALLTLTAAVPAAAQLTDAGTPVRPPGWSVTPAIGVSEMWDDNPTLAAEGDVRTGDFVTAVRPSLALDFRGRHTTVRSDYAGIFDFYRDLTGLNTRDHRAGLDFTHQATRRLQLFARDQAMLSPTTADALEVGATVLRRQTTRMNAFSGGFEATLGRQTTLNAAYASQWIEFANDDNEPVSPIPPSDELLLGGHSHGGIGELRHRLNQRFAIGADYDDPARHRRQRHRDLRRAERARRVGDRAGADGVGLVRLRPRLADGRATGSATTGPRSTWVSNGPAATAARRCATGAPSCRRSASAAPSRTKSCAPRCARP